MKLGESLPSAKVMLRIDHITIQSRCNVISLKNWSILHSMWVSFNVEERGRYGPVTLMLSEGGTACYTCCHFISLSNVLTDQRLYKKQPLL